MTGHLAVATSDPERDAARFVKLLVRTLRDCYSQVDGLRVDVRVGIFRLARKPMHPFSGVSSARFWLVPERGRILVEYNISLVGAALVLFVFAAVGSAISWSARPSPWNLGGPVFVTAVAFGLNWLCAYVSVRRFIGRIGRRVTDLRRYGSGRRHSNEDDAV
jgi:hypothetical protein